MDNFVSFSRFTALNPNISEHGATVEELVSTRGKPDPDPVASPMASPAVSAVQLALSNEGSDRLRLAGPLQPTVNPYDGPKRTLVLSRTAVAKLDGRVIGDLQSLVKSGTVGTEEVRARMLDSMQRVNGMREYVSHLNGLTESVVAHAVSAAKP